MKFRLIFVVGMMAVVLSGCGSIEQWWSHKKSAIVGLDRIATLYSYDGKVIKTWEFSSQVEEKNNTVRFMVNGNAVNIYGGTLVIEEK